MEQGILTGKEVARQVGLGRITISPFDPSLVNPVSVDLRLGRGVAVYSNVTAVDLDRLTRKQDLAYSWESNGGVLDARVNNAVHTFDIPDAGLLLMPGILYLMHTEEVVSTDHYVPVLDGKSSIGRLGVQVHETAGYGDPSYSGQYTLEVTCVHRVRLYAGMRFCQMRFHTLVGAVQAYTGNYMGETALGPVPSRSWKQFKE